MGRGRLEQANMTRTDKEQDTSNTYLTKAVTSKTSLYKLLGN